MLKLFLCYNNLVQFCWFNPVNHTLLYYLSFDIRNFEFILKTIFLPQLSFAHETRKQSHQFTKLNLFIEFECFYRLSLKIRFNTRNPSKFVSLLIR